MKINIFKQKTIQQFREVFLSEIMPEKIIEIPAEKTWELRQEVMWPDRDLDFVKLAEAYGAAGIRIEKVGDITQITGGISSFIK